MRVWTPALVPNQRPGLLFRFVPRPAGSGGSAAMARPATMPMAPVPPAASVAMPVAPAMHRRHVKLGKRLHLGQRSSSKRGRCLRGSGRGECQATRDGNCTQIGRQLFHDCPPDCSLLACDDLNAQLKPAVSLCCQFFGNSLNRAAFARWARGYSLAPILAKIFRPSMDRVRLGHLPAAPLTSRSLMLGCMWKLRRRSNGHFDARIGVPHARQRP